MYNAERKPEFQAAAREVHTLNAKWWHDIDTGRPIVRHLGELVMLVVSELSEAMEGYRKDLWDDHLPHRKMIEVELADAVIRLFDLMGAGLEEVYPRFNRYPQDNVNLAKAESGDSEDIAYVAMRFGDNIPEGLLLLTKYVVDIYTHRFWVDTALCVALIDKFALAYDIDLWGAYHEKNSYNSDRRDHSHEARRQEGGKKF